MDHKRQSSGELPDRGMLLEPHNGKVPDLRSADAQSLMRQMNFRILKYGILYFALVFAAGFLLGTIRVLALEPAIGTRYAELIEMPVMLFISYLAAKFTVSRMPDTNSGMPCLVVGVTALALLLLFEFTLVLGLQGISFGQYIDSRDEIAFAAYIGSLIIFAFMPFLVWRHKNRAGA